MKYAMVAGIALLGISSLQAGGFDLSPHSGTVYLFAAALLCAAFVGFVTRAPR